MSNNSPKQATPIESILPEIPQKITEMCSIYVPDKGYLCRIRKDESPGSISIIEPIQITQSHGEMQNPYDAVIGIVRKQLNGSTDGKPIIATLAKNTQVTEGGAFNEQTRELKRNPTMVFNVELDPDTIQALTAHNDLVFVPEGYINPQTLLPENYSNGQFLENAELQFITTNNETIKAIVHPDCALLYRSTENRPIEITDGNNIRKHLVIGRKIIEKIESVEHSDDTLKLDHIDAIAALVPDTKLAETLKAAFIRDKLLTLGLQQVTLACLEGTVVNGILHNSEVVTALALSGVIGASAFGETTQDKLFEQSFAELFHQALLELDSTYKISGALGLETLDFYSIVRTSANLTDIDALKSKVTEKTLSLGVNSAVLAVNGRLVESGIYAALGITTNVLQGKYKKSLEAKLMEEEAQEKDQETESKLKKFLKRFAKLLPLIPAPLAKAVAEYGPNILAKLPFKSVMELELSINLLSFLTSHQIEQIRITQESIERKQTLGDLEAILRWIANDAQSLGSEKHYAYYCKEKQKQYEHDQARMLAIPKSDPLGTEKTPQEVQYIPGEYARKIAESNTEARIKIKVLGEQPTTISNQPIFKRLGSAAEYQFLVAGLTVETPRNKVLLADATLHAENGYVTEIRIGDDTELPILTAIAERSKSISGTTFIKTPKGEKNVHMSTDRSDISYYDCNIENSYILFDGRPNDEIQTLLQESKILSDTEIQKVLSIYNNGADIRQIRAIHLTQNLRIKLALIEALNQKQSIKVINNPFNGLDENDEIAVANYLQRMAQNSVIILRTDKSKQILRNTLHESGILKSYEIDPESRALVAEKPDVAETVFALRNQGIVDNTWNEPLVRKLAQEIIVERCEIVVENEIPLRKVSNLRAHIYARDADSKKYVLKQLYMESAPDENGRITLSDRSKEEFSLYAITGKEDPENILNHRLRQLGIDTSTISQQIGSTRSVKRENSKTFPQLITEYTFNDREITVESPLTADALHSHIIVAHSTGSRVVYRWVEVEE